MDLRCYWIFGEFDSARAEGTRKAHVWAIDELDARETFVWEVNNDIRGTFKSPKMPVSVKINAIRRETQAAEIEIMSRMAALEMIGCMRHG